MGRSRAGPSSAVAVGDPAERSVDVRLVAAARGGDEEAFVRLTGPERPALHAHCYRLVGSLHDADDALQETLLRAWRGIGRFEPRAPLAAWLHTIATNVCLRMLEQRARRAAVTVDAHLEPYPERLLEELPSPERGPEAIAEAREAIGLAFVAAMQLLPPRQRAVLVLRDVLGWSARDVAGCLDDSLASVNSAPGSAWSASGESRRSRACTGRRVPPPRRRRCAGSRSRGTPSTTTASSRCSSTTRC